MSEPEKWGGRFRVLGGGFAYGYFEGTVDPGSEGIVMRVVLGEVDNAIKAVCQSPDQVPGQLAAITEQLNQACAPRLEEFGARGRIVIFKLDGPQIPKEPPPVAVIQNGAQVQVQWSDGNRYPGTVLQSTAEQVLVQMSNGQQHWVEARYVTVS